MSKLAAALHWKYGPVASCDLDQGIITRWLHPTVPEPDAARRAVIIAEYEAAQLAVAYRQDRKRAYAAELGAGGDAIETIGDVLDDVIREIAAIRAGDPTTAEFAALLGKIAAIKARIPKPS